jgi:hypothetical protein
MSTSATEATKQLWAWTGKADAKKGDSWNLMWRQLELRLGAGEHAVSCCLDPAHEANKLKEVLAPLSSAGLTMLSKAKAITLWKIKNDERNLSRESAKEHNKYRLRNHARALVILQEMFKGGSNVARTITSAIDVTDGPVAQFTKALAALRGGYEPSGVVDGMALKVELVEHSSHGYLAR